MNLEMFPRIDTTDIDMLVASYAHIHVHTHPADLVSVGHNGSNVSDEMLNLIKAKAMDLAGIAVYGSAQFAVGLDSIDETVPSLSLADGACNFTGKLASVKSIDFTGAMLKADLIKPEAEKVFLPGLIFESDYEIAESAPALGVLSLAPYCAVLPGSAYELRRMLFAA